MSPRRSPMISSVSVDNAWVRHVNQTSSDIFTLVRDILQPQIFPPNNSLSLSLQRFSLSLKSLNQVESSRSTKPSPGRSKKLSSFSQGNRSLEGWNLCFTPELPQKWIFHPSTINGTCFTNILISIQLGIIHEAYFLYTRERRFV